MSEDRRRVLEMLAESKISVEEAERLLRALDGNEGGDKAQSGESQRPLPRYLRMVGKDKDREVFRLKVPLSLLRAGIKLKALIPEEARQRTTEQLRAKGIEVDPFELSSDEIDDFIRALGELEMEAADDSGSFRIFLE